MMRIILTTIDIYVFPQKVIKNTFQHILSDETEIINSKFDKIRQLDKISQKQKKNLNQSMGCTGSINHTTQNVEQPIKNCSSTIIRHQSKIIKFAQAHIDSNAQQSDKKPKNVVILKKEEKIKQIKNNKEFIELSIQTSYCVNKLLNTLAQNQIFEDRQLKNLLSKNNQALAQKQNRYKNLEAREQKMELELKKQIERKEKVSNTRKTVPAKSKQQMSQRKYNLEVGENPIFRNSNNDQSYTENKQNRPSNSVYLQSDYKSKFIKKIDKFRSEVNTLVPKTNLQF